MHSLGWGAWVESDKWIIYFDIHAVICVFYVGPWYSSGSSSTGSWCSTKWIPAASLPSNFYHAALGTQCTWACVGNY